MKTLTGYSEYRQMSYLTGWFKVVEAKGDTRKARELARQELERRRKEVESLI